MRDQHEMDDYYAMRPKTTVDELVSLAKHVVERFMRRSSAQLAFQGGCKDYFNYPAWARIPKPKLRYPSKVVKPTDPGFQGDMLLYNTILSTIDTALHVEYRHAVASADVGRVLKVV